MVNRLIAWSNGWAHVHIICGGMTDVCLGLMGGLRFARWMHLFARRMVQAHVGWVDGWMGELD